MTLFRILVICFVAALVLSGCGKYTTKRPVTASAGVSKSKSKLSSLNRHYNNLIRYKEDGEVDHWQTPMETLGLGTGDCEDIGIAKMYDPILRNLFPVDQIRLSYVYAADGRAHMVLFVGKGRDALVLDNLHDEVVSVAESGYTPIYQLDAAGRVYRNDRMLVSHPGLLKFNAVLAAL